jgi:hypothetical protein
MFEVVDHAPKTKFGMPLHRLAIVKLIIILLNAFKDQSTMLILKNVNLSLLSLQILLNQFLLEITHQLLAQELQLFALQILLSGMKISSFVLNVLSKRLGTTILPKNVKLVLLTLSGIHFLKVVFNLDITVNRMSFGMKRQINVKK